MVLSVRTDEALEARVKAEASLRGITQTDLLKQAILSFLESPDTTAIDELKVENQALSDKVIGLQKELVTALDSYSVALSQLNRAKEDLNDALGRLAVQEKLEDQIAELTKANEEIGYTLVDNEMTVETLQAQVDELNGKLDQYRAVKPQLEARLKERDDLIDEVQNLQVKLSHYQEKYIQAEAKLMRLEAPEAEEEDDGPGIFQRLFTRA